MSKWNHLLVNKKKISISNSLYWDFPGGPVVKNPPSNAGDTGSIPGWGTISIVGRGTKIPHATGRLSPHTTTREPARCNERSHMPQLRPDAAKN